MVKVLSELIFAIHYIAVTTKKVSGSHSWNVILLLCNHRLPPDGKPSLQKSISQNFKITKQISSESIFRNGLQDYKLNCCGIHFVIQRGPMVYSYRKGFSSWTLKFSCNNSCMNQWFF